MDPRTLPCLILFAGCVEAPLEGDIIVIGDSIFDWNVEEASSIPDVIATELGLEVANAAIGGTQLTEGPDAIPDQYQPRGWRAVIRDGGGNDLNDQCGCGECDAVMDAIVSEDGAEGVVPDLVRQITAGGIPVVFWSYYELPEDAEFGFDRCRDDIPLLFSRLETLAETEPDFLVVDGRDVVKATDLAYFDEDHVHPSVEGGEVVGRQLAEAVEGVLD